MHMKNAINKIFVVAAFAATTHVAIAQTPYDDFAPNETKKEMLRLPDVIFRAYNADTTNAVKYVELDKELLVLKYFSQNDTLISQVQLDIKDFKWLSVDPLASKYPSHSPYNFVLNNPLNAIDPDGRDVVFLIDKEGAGGRGHMGMLFQDKAGAWYYFTQGAAENGSTSGFLSGSNYRGGVGIVPMQTVTKSGDVINMTKEQAIDFVKAGKVDGTKYDDALTLKTTNKQDAQITQNAYSLRTDFQNKKEEYNVYFNNCTDAVQDVVEGSKGVKTGITLPTDYNPQPNSYFQQLQTTVPWMNGDLQQITVPSTMDNYPAQQFVVPTIPQTPTTTP